MILLYILTCYILNNNECSNVDGYASNSFSLSPISNAVILNDLMDIFNEFDNKLNSQFDIHPIDSESDESIADLLYQYQHYLDRAYNQNVNYLEKTNVKNKVPPKRNDKYPKKKMSTQRSHNDLKNVFSSNVKYMPYFDSLENFTPSKNAQEISLFNPDILHTKEAFDNFDSSNLLKNIYLPPVFPKYKNGDIISSCYCKDNIIPCKCDCKQCLVDMSSLSGKSQYFTLDNPNLGIDILPETPKYLVEEKTLDSLDNKINIRVKVDVHLPKTFEILQKRNRNHTQNLEEAVSRESTPKSNVPLPYLPQMNYPIPIDIFSFRKPFLFAKEPTHKITIHKKKKTRFSNNGKKHKTKKILSINFDTILPKTNISTNFTLNNTCTNGSSNKLCENENQHIFKNELHNNVTTEGNYSLSLDGSASRGNDKNNQSIETIYLTVNISNDVVNKTDDFPKLENSIETEINTKENITTLAPLKGRLKREVTTEDKNEPKLKVIGLLDKPKNVTKHKLNKVLTDDDELLYWPDMPNNASAVIAKNITTLILEREKKKSKLNMTKDIIQNNHTGALEQAIFGDVNWDDMDTVVPVFISFVGKYINGILSFCSQTMCHSMKCVEKLCLHRACQSAIRYHQKGHCVGNNRTDSVAALESIMDLPSNLALEIVDILQDKMLGKMYGKATLCITTKCVTFVASKKTFIKSKCTNKELGPTGHCPNKGT